MCRQPSHHRRSIRLDRYDYTQPGAYFITLVTAGRIPCFGEVAGGEMHLNPAGQMAQREWLRLASRFPGLAIDAYSIMPNHVHGILIICPVGDHLPGPPVGAQRDGPMHGSSLESLRPYEDRATRDDRRPTVSAGSLGAIVRAFKSSTTLRYHRMRGACPGLLWQRNYYEHIVRGAAALDRIRAYIIANPTRWELDDENPLRVAK